MDETDITRSKRNRKGEKRTSGKSTGEQVVCGMVARDGRIVAKHVGGTISLWQIEREVSAHVEPGTRLVTDEHARYRRMNKSGFEHATIKHAEKVYAKGDIHTQTIENFWMTLKGGLRGVYHGVGTTTSRATSMSTPSATTGAGKDSRCLGLFWIGFLALWKGLSRLL
jgi:hypothetical protein